MVVILFLFYFFMSHKSKRGGVLLTKRMHEGGVIDSVKNKHLLNSACL